MKVNFSPWFSARPYMQRKDGTVRFNEKTVGPAGLLAVLQDAAGIHYEAVSAQVRAAVYCRNMKAAIRESDLFYRSFLLDPMGVSNRILSWRDNLVAAGWDVKGTEPLRSAKLDFIRRIEPEALPVAESDMWLEVLKLAQAGGFKDAEIDLEVCVPENMIPPFYAKLIEALKKSGVACCYKNTCLCKEPVVETKVFENEDRMLEYAVSNISDWDLVVCEDAKKLDNMFRYVGLPTSGSDLSMAEPQILQLFKLGNSLFKYPCSVTSLLGWLNAPKSPLKGLGWWLARAVISSGGIYNEKWYQAVKDYECRNEGADAGKILNEFLPVPRSAEIRTEDVVAFNERLGRWADACCSLAQTEDVIAQYALLGESCRAMCEVLHDAEETISPEDVSRYMSRVAVQYRGKHCEAQAGCAKVVSSPSNIADKAGNVLWLGVYDNKTHRYMYDFLTDGEIAELIDKGVLLYTRDDDSQYVWYQQRVPLMMSGKIMLAIPKKVCGAGVIEHPVVTELGRKEEEHGVLLSGEIKLEEKKKLFLMSSLDDDGFIRLNEGVMLESRDKESASSLDKLVFNPFDYVIEYCLGIKDKQIADPNDLTNVQGTVCHKFVERLFMDGRNVRELQEVKAIAACKEDLEILFDECVEECGLVLLEPGNMSKLYEAKEHMLAGINKLIKIIENNRLAVVGCEVGYDDVPFIKTQDKEVNLRGSVDMLLRDSNGDYVIFDFKYSIGNWYEEKLKSNKSVQLAVYKYFLGGKNVRSAYIFFKRMRGVSTDGFEYGVKKISPKEKVDMIQYVKDAYLKRWEQFSQGLIDCNGEEDKYSKCKDLKK